LGSLQQFHDTIENHIRSLSSLGKDVNSYALLLLPIILSKLPPDTKKNLARNHPADEWRLEELQKAIRSEIRIFESGLNIGHLIACPSTASFYTTAKNVHTQHQGTAASSKKKCVYCSGAHAPSLCSIVTDPSKCLETIKQQRLCFNCLAHHKVTQCTSKHCCQICRCKHHTSLCTKKPSTVVLPPQNRQTTATTPQSNQVTSAAQGTSTQGTPTTSFATISRSTQNPKSLHTGNSKCLLKTAIATITTSTYQVTAHILTTVFHTPVTCR